MQVEVSKTCLSTFLNLYCFLQARQEQLELDQQEWLQVQQQMQMAQQQNAYPMMHTMPPAMQQQAPNQEFQDQWQFDAPLRSFPGGNSSEAVQCSSRFKSSHKCFWYGLLVAKNFTAADFKHRLLCWISVASISGLYSTTCWRAIYYGRLFEQLWLSISSNSVGVILWWCSSEPIFCCCVYKYIWDDDWCFVKVWWKSYPGGFSNPIYSTPARK